MSIHEQKEGKTKMQHFFPLPGHDLFYNAHIPALGKKMRKIKIQPQTASEVVFEVVASIGHWP